MKKQDIAKKMTREEKDEHHYQMGRVKRNGSFKQKGKESLNSTAKHQVDFEGQRSYREEDT